MTNEKTLIVAAPERGIELRITAAAVWQILKDEGAFHGSCSAFYRWIAAGWVSVVRGPNRTLFLSLREVHEAIAIEPMDEQPLIEMSEAHRRLQEATTCAIPMATFYRWTQDGILRTVHEGTRLLTSVREVERFASLWTVTRAKKLRLDDD